jgi:hypothetical protein
MAIVDAMLVLDKDIAKVSNFLAKNIRPTSYELFQEELDRCYQESERIVGKRLSEFLREHSETIFKIAAWVIPGSANRAAFEETLNPLFKSMEEIETAWEKVAEFTKVSLSFVSPGEDLADFETYQEDATEPGIQISNETSPSQNIVLGTAALGIHCLFRNGIKGVEDQPRIILAAKVILEANLRYMFLEDDQKPPSISNQRSSQPGDGRDP